jgi:hypothetical protein
MADEYTIVTLADLFNVPRDRWDALVADLRAWMDFTTDKAPALCDKIGKQLGADSGTPMLYMTWRDDDTVGFNGGVIVHLFDEQDTTTRVASDS